MAQQSSHVSHVSASASLPHNVEDMASAYPTDTVMTATMKTVSVPRALALT